MNKGSSVKSTAFAMQKILAKLAGFATGTMETSTLKLTRRTSNWICRWPCPYFLFDLKECTRLMHNFSCTNGLICYCMCIRCMALMFFFVCVFAGREDNGSMSLDSTLGWERMGL